MWLGLFYIGSVTLLTNLRCLPSAAAISAEVVSVDNVPEAEYIALYDLYNATIGEKWYWGKQPGIKWNFKANANPCADKWEGVTCASASSNAQLHVSAVQLNGYNLRGYLPSSISNLTYMVKLTLPNNHLGERSLPASIGNLQHLFKLDLETSGIQGELPDIFSGMVALWQLDLTGNYFTGGIPESLCSARNLTVIHLSDNQLHGTIPECLHNLKALWGLEVDRNMLFGTLPSALGKLDSLEVLLVGSNELTGTIPSEFAQLQLLETIDLSSNQLNGTLPSFLGNFPDLLSIDLSVNEFSGSVPSSVGNLTKIISLVAHSNQLTGTCPNSLCNLTFIEQLDFSGNQLRGTLPPCWGNWTQLQFLDVRDNEFSGPIPAEFGKLSLLLALLLSNNTLTGAIPSSLLRSMGQLKALMVDHNDLSGPVPDDLFDHPTLEILALQQNQLSGQLPLVQAVPNDILMFIVAGENHLTGPITDAISNFPNLIYLDLTNNSFTGAVPAELCTLRILNYMYLTHNLFSGLLPECWAKAGALSYLFLDSNQLSGSIPASIGDMPVLQSLNLSSNHLTGTIPAAFSNLSQLEVLLLDNNQLTGSLYDVFDPSIQKNLAILQIGSNQLTGTLPDALFELELLQVFAAVSNCFSGSIPLSACACATVVTLALDGLQSATSCQNKLFPASFNGAFAPNLYSIRSPLTGGIPTCLFQMANLTTLHLSGNGLTGTLPANLSIIGSLTDLSLSHNSLKGRIPASLLSRNWSNLDLSYNSFTHSLSVADGFSFETDAVITLEQNRLSGGIPKAFADLAPIYILESNIFSCDSQRSDLPAGDPNAGKYQCGSDTWNATIYAWLAVVVVVAIAAAVVLRWRRRSWEAEIALVRQWWGAGASHISQLQTLAEMQAAVANILRLSVTCMGYIICILLPLDGITSIYYGTYDHAYAWTLSVAYVSGHSAFALLLASLLILIVFVSLCSTKLTSDAPSLVDTDNFLWAINWSRVALYSVYIAINFAIVLGVNIAYVVIALNQNGEALTLAQISLAVFKVAFNGVCSPLLIRWTSHRVLKSSEEASTADLISIQLFVTLVNNILIPCLVVAIISPDCFYNLFDSASAVSSFFTYPGKCVSFVAFNARFVGCSAAQSLTAVTSYNPPFAYSYQCSSSFITYYAPAYVIMCIIASFAIPVAQVVLQRLHSRAEKDTRWFALLDLLLPRILKPLDAASPPGGRNVFAPYFDATQHMITLLTYVGLLLTFGAVFPPLALCFALTIVSIAVFTKLKVGRLLAQAVELAAPQYLAVVNKECEGVGSPAILGRSIGMMVVFSCLFYTLFLFDTLGDAVGASKAYWVLIVMPLIPLGFTLFYFLYQCRINTLFKSEAAVNINVSRENGKETETEMIVRSPLAHV